MHPPVKDPAINRLTGLIPGPHRHRAADLLIEICFEYHRVAESNHLYLSGLALQLISGLEAAASGGVLHRDIKPSNCFIDPSGIVKVGDFGLSVSSFAGLASQLTVSG